MWICAHLLAILATCNCPEWHACIEYLQLCFILLCFPETTTSYARPTSAENYQIIMFRLEYTLYLCLKMTPPWYVESCDKFCSLTHLCVYYQTHGHACMHTHTDTYPHPPTHTHTHTWTHTHTHKHTHTLTQRASPGSTIEVEVIALDQQKHNTSAFLELAQISDSQVIVTYCTLCLIVVTQTPCVVWMYMHNIWVVHVKSTYVNIVVRILD